MSSFDRPPEGLTRSGQPRFIGLDVARAVAMIGVVVMNYHGMINFSGWSSRSTSFVERVFDIRTGALSTRFAAMFVVVAGYGITLLTERARRIGSSAELVDTRLRLLRRGAALLIGGYLLDLAWPGTILFYYGVYFVLAAFVFHLRTRILAAIAVASTIVTVGISSWRRARLLDGDALLWMSPYEIRTARDVAARVFLGYTHPVFPWIVFLLAGMILGRHIDTVRLHMHRVLGALVGVIVVAYAAATAIESVDVSDRAILHTLSSMQPDERGLAYVVSTSAIAITALLTVSLVAERHRENALVIALRRAGQLSLTLYLGHVLFYYAVYEWLDWGFGRGLGPALLLAVSYWVLAVVIASWWHHRIGTGPAERLYRFIGG